MKKVVFDKTGNWMQIDTGHKTFDRQTNIISEGNIVANTMLGLHIRSWTTTKVHGFERPPGELFEFDMKPFAKLGLKRWRGAWAGKSIEAQIREMLLDESGWLYAFFHWNYIYNRRYIDNRQRITHGFVLTHYNHVLWKTWVVGPTYKSYNVIDVCAEYVSFADENERSQHEQQRNDTKS